MKKSLAKKTILRLVLLGLLIMISVNAVAAYRFYREQLDEYTEAAYSYVKMISLDISGETIEKMISYGDALRNRIVNEFAYYEEEWTIDNDDKSDKVLTDLGMKWIDTYSFVFQTISYNSDFIAFEVIVPEKDNVICIWSETSNPDMPLDPMRIRPYKEKERELLASKSVDLSNLSGTDVAPEIDETLTFFQDKNTTVGTAILPIISSEGKTVAFAELDVSITEIRTGILHLMLDIDGIILLIMAAALVFYYFLQKRQVINPIIRLESEASDAVNKLKEGGSPFVTDIHTGDEIESLSHSFENMGESLRSYINENAEITAERERINTELSMAASIQSDMLPAEFPAFPDRNDFEIYASMTPAKEVGGDFYDFFLIDENTLALVIADVSGKGVPASLFMMRSMIMIENLATGTLSPASVLDKVNKQLCAHNETQMFVTIWLGILDLKTGVMKAVNAGHEYPIIRDPNGGFEVLVDKHCFVAGGMEMSKYKDYELQLAPGSTVFLYTDGLSEAQNTKNEMFGVDRELEVLNRNPDASPEELLKMMECGVKEFVEGEEQFDDLTMLCLKYSGPDIKEQEE